ncbi:2791_t:CDS:2 [Paraglomus brasilianum]|uniref:2791_t:CDS:1 n=1 Tax=Paraglomus brasilianum TaxID=144538 RepID=A0A9N9G473_9GLOM|nr:2791_t:CDS:2 [Paraglomus brasilianum]
MKSSVHLYLAEMPIIEEDSYSWCDDYVREDYDRGVHVLSVFLVLTASTLGTLTPILQDQKKSGNLSLLINCGKHFGTGVILATAFIHMLPGAVQMLTSPCLPKAFHSYYTAFAGITLGVTGDVKFAGLLCALLLHQFFEGFALGARISELDISRLKKLYMSLAFILTTPSGIIIGIALASSYNPNSVVALVVQGTLDSVSAGILIYAAYANLLAIEITGNTSFRKLPGRTKVYYFLSIYVGAAIMASLGRWA